MRDIALARLTGAPVHFHHLSTAGSVDLVRGGQGRAACRSRPRRRPHHFPSPTTPAPATTRCSR